MKRVILSFFLSFYILTSVAQDEKLITAPSAYKKEVSQLIKDQKVKTAFEIIRDLEPETMKELIELTQIPAPPFMEQKHVQNILKRCFRLQELIQSGLIKQAM